MYSKAVGPPAVGRFCNAGAQPGRGQGVPESAALQGVLCPGSASQSMLVWVTWERMQQGREPHQLPAEALHALQPHARLRQRAQPRGGDGPTKDERHIERGDALRQLRFADELWGQGLLLRLLHLVDNCRHTLVWSLLPGQQEGHETIATPEALLVKY